MAKQYSGDNSPLTSNPFAALRPASATASKPDIQRPEPDVTAENTIKFPKMKSARKERANRGGKTVTVITFHGEPDDAQKTMWLKTAKRELGVGGTIEDGQVMLQGDLVSRLKEWKPE